MLALSHPLTKPMPSACSQQAILMPRRHHGLLPLKSGTSKLTLNGKTVGKKLTCAVGAAR